MINDFFNIIYFYLLVGVGILGIILNSLSGNDIQGFLGICLIIIALVEYILYEKS